MVQSEIGHFTWPRRRVGREFGKAIVPEMSCTFNAMAAEIEDRIRQLRRAAEENKELFLGTVRALAQAIDAKDPYTRGHSVRVNRYSMILGRKLGLSEDERAWFISREGNESEDGERVSFPRWGKRNVISFHFTELVP